jgi:hypothetical protein
MSMKLMRYESEQLSRHPPRLAKGEALPTRPVYWMIWILDEKTKKPYHSRGCWDKVLTPLEAYQNAYGSGIPSENTLFFNLSGRLTDARKKVQRLAKLWREAGGS